MCGEPYNRTIFQYNFRIERNVNKMFSEIYKYMLLKKSLPLIHIKLIFSSYNDGYKFNTIQFELKSVFIAFEYYFAVFRV